jgi:SIR2-like protein
MTRERTARPGSPAMEPAAAAPLQDPAAGQIPAPLLAALSDGLVVPFVGAGISMPPPSSLPSAQQLADELVGRGHGAPGDDLEEVAEKMFAEGGWKPFARAIPSEDWRAREPNDCHMVIAELAAEGLVRVVLTTNWDTMLETALNQCGVPFARIATPVDLALWNGVAPRVVKLHGCIDSPETIRARRTEVDAADWMDAWAEALFATTVRSNSFLFAGYSGASRATTRSIEKVSAEESRVEVDWMVGRTPFDSAVTRDRSKRLLDATGTPGDRYLNMDTVEFFQSLRKNIQPLIHRRGVLHAVQLIESLLAPTKVSGNSFIGELESVAAKWAAGDAKTRQALMRQMIPKGASRHYLPFVEHAQVIGRLWAWFVLVKAAGALDLDDTGTIATVRTDGVERIEVLPVLCGPVERRDEAALTLLAGIADDFDAPTRSYLGVVVGGVGPLSPPASPLNIARGVPVGDVVRGGHLSVNWATADAVFDVISRDADMGEVVTAIRERVLADIASLTTA